MSHPKKHHYLPEFYLKRWCGADGRVSDFRRFQGELVHRRRFPSETGFERELYSIPSRADQATRQAVETRIMARLDNEAAQALSFMEETGKPPKSARHRVGWTRFLLSLLHRSPYRMAKMRAKLDDHADDVLRDIASRYESLRAPTDPPTFAEYIEADDRAVVHESLAVLLQNLMNSKVIGQAFANMIWGWARINKSKHGLLTSDMPLMVSNGVGHRDAFIMLPVAPDALFIASPRREIIESFASQRSQDLERALNDAVVRQARNIVIADRSSAHRFVDARFLRGAEPEGEWMVHTWQHPLIDLREGVVAPSRPPLSEIKRDLRRIRSGR